MLKVTRSFSHFTHNPRISLASIFNQPNQNGFCLQSCRTMSSKKLVAADRIKDTEANVWVEFGQLALDHNPVNLGQGFPDFPAPNHIVKAMCDAVQSDNVLLNQYTRSYGHPRLVNVLAKYLGRFVQRDIDPRTEILVTVGAYESLYCAILGNVNPGDEVVIIEPFFDAYEPMVVMAGGIPVFIPLRPEAIAVGFEIEMERLEKPDCYFAELATTLQGKRDRVVDMLERAGMIPVVPEGGYFILADYSQIGDKFDFEDGGSKPKDHKFSRWLTIEKKLASIPPSSFYSLPNKHIIENYVRFCFIKNDNTLNAAEQILLQLKIAS